jgi:hypothetical protein
LIDVSRQQAKFDYGAMNIDKVVAAIKVRETRICSRPKKGAVPKIRGQRLF